MTQSVTSHKSNMSWLLEPQFSLSSKITVTNYKRLLKSWVNDCWEVLATQDLFCKAIKKKRFRNTHCCMKFHSSEALRWQGQKSPQEWAASQKEKLMYWMLGEGIPWILALSGPKVQIPSVIQAFCSEMDHTVPQASLKSAELYAICLNSFPNLESTVWAGRIWATAPDLTFSLMTQIFQHLIEI